MSTLRTGTSAALLESGDLQEALDAAAAVGDDAIQQQTTGQVNPESWTHGSSEQRYQWLNQGFTTGSTRQLRSHGHVLVPKRIHVFGSVPLRPVNRYRGIVSG